MTGRLTAKYHHIGRLKLLDGQQFIYLQRGLPRVLCVDEHTRAVSWGQLQLVFKTEQQLVSFLQVLRCAL